MRNSDKIYEINEIKQNKEEYAKDFSEGDKILEAILRLAFKNDIYTQACCKGHPFTELIYAPYLVFLVEEKNKKMYSMMLEYFEKSKNKELLNVGLIKVNGYVAISIHHNFKNRFDFNKQKLFFMTIYKALEYGIDNKDNINEKFLELINLYEYLCEDVSYSGNFEIESLESNPVFLKLKKIEGADKLFRAPSKAENLIARLDTMFRVVQSERIYDIDMENLDKYYFLSRSLKSKH